MGIDPGDNGGWAVINDNKQYVDSGRWPKGGIKTVIGQIFPISELIAFAYIEEIHFHSHVPFATAKKMQPLLVNFGIWQGILGTMSIPYELITPVGWQARVGLTSWKKKLTSTPNPMLTPLGMAMTLFPQANLRFQTQDGEAVALLLAECAHREYTFARANPKPVQQSLDLPMRKRKAKNVQKQAL